MKTKLPALFITKENIRVVREFHKSFPNDPITVDNILAKTSGSLSQNSATKAIGSLVKLGVLDPKGFPTTLGLRWLSPTEYADASKDILQKFFPTGMLDIFTDANKSIEIADWLIEHAEIGSESAKKDAYAFRLLYGESNETPRHESSIDARKVTPTETITASSPERRETHHNNAPLSIRVPMNAPAQELQKIIDLARANNMSIICY